MPSTMQIGTFDHNFVCRACDAKLLGKRIESPFRPGERATCPFCMAVLPPRDAEHLIQYELVERPKSPPVASGAQDVP
jgi:hypothetical protein